MDFLRSIDLKNQIEVNGKVDLTIVDDQGNVTEKTFTDYQQAKCDIEFLEIDHQVYF